MCRGLAGCRHRRESGQLGGGRQSRRGEGLAGLRDPEEGAQADGGRESATEPRGLVSADPRVEAQTA